MRAKSLENQKNTNRFTVIHPYLREGGIGAELGVFKGGFIPHLLMSKPSKLFAVDPWYLLGPEWAWAKKEKSTVRAFKRILSEFQVEIEAGVLVPKVEFSEVFLNSLPDQSLDWVYIDSSHSYKGTKAELKLCLNKVKKGGFIIGDDFHEDPGHHHHGVFRAVQEIVEAGIVRLAVVGNEKQFVLSLND